MKISYFGHSTFLFELKGKHILMDPYFTGNPSCDVDPMTVDCDYLLISHGHWDHVMDAVKIAERTDCVVISNYEICAWLNEQGVKNTVDLNHGGRATVDFGTVKYVNAVHSSVLPDGTHGGNPGGFIIQGDGQEIYFAGDTALCMDMELIGRHHNLTLALLPIGDKYTMGVEDGAIASEMIQCKNIIGMHFDTFPVLCINHEEAKKTFATRGSELTLMKPGETLEY